MKKNILICICLSLLGCGESLPEQDAKDKNAPPSYEKEIRKDAATNKDAQKKETAKTQTAPQNTSQAVKPQTAPQTALPTAETSKKDSAVSFSAPLKETEVGAIINYGTGSLPNSIKKKQEEKLKKIQEGYSEKTKKTLSE
jgi:hypothetical protein